MIYFLIFMLLSNVLCIAITIIGLLNINTKIEKNIDYCHALSIRMDREKDAVDWGTIKTNGKINSLVMIIEEILAHHDEKIQYHWSLHKNYGVAWIDEDKVTKCNKE